jgi:hypothetical protein
LAERLLAVNPLAHVDCERRRYSAGTLSGGEIAVASLDNLPARYQVWYDVEGTHSYLVDPRTGLEEWEVHSVLGGTPWSARFGGIKFPDPATIERLPCGLQTIAYTGAGVASVVCAFVRAWVVDGPWYGSVYGDWKVPVQTMAFPA